jgi:hypothetical protein
LAGKPNYSSLRQVKLSPKYSSPVANRKVNNIILILHFLVAQEQIFQRGEEGLKVCSEKADILHRTESNFCPNILDP